VRGEGWGTNLIRKKAKRRSFYLFIVNIIATGVALAGAAGWVVEASITLAAVALFHPTKEPLAKPDHGPAKAVAHVSHQAKDKQCFHERRIFLGTRPTTNYRTKIRPQGQTPLWGCHEFKPLAV
jgi:hypothetical protein